MSQIAEGDGSRIEQTGGSARFVRQSDGRLVFFPFGRASPGYAIGDAQREHALRARFQTFDTVETALALFLLPFLMAGFYFFWNSNRWVCASIVIGAALYERWRRRRIGKFVVGLERVPAQNQEGRRTLKIAATVTMVWALLASWIYWTYTPERAALLADQDIIFYTDISIPLFGTLFGLGLPIFVVQYRNAIGRQRIKAGLFAVLSLLITLFFILFVAVIYVRPIPEIVLTPNSIRCGHHEAKWSEVVDVQLAYGRRGSERAHLLLKHPASLPVQDQDVLDCSVGWTTANPDVVYDAIYTHWQHGRSP